MTNRWSLKPQASESRHLSDMLPDGLTLNPIVRNLLAQRGVITAEEIKKFFKPSLTDLHDPFLMPDMEKAGKRLNKALGNQENILTYGDYDGEGPTAVTIVSRFCRS